MLLSNVNFILSAPNKKSWPEDDKKEVCFLGKSNVGKSSLLNALTNNKKMAKVSSTPGCTKLINFFDVDGKYRIVDAPGYGYHKNSISSDKLFAIWDGIKTGGVYSTIRKAQKKNLDIVYYPRDLI